MSKCRALLALSAVLTLGACAVTDHFDNRVNTYDIAAEQARDVMILTNIVRASHAEPMSFVQLGKVSGGSTSTATVGLPSLILGPLSGIAATASLQREVVFGANPAGGNGTIGNSASMTGSINFDVSPAETKGFYHGLLAPVDPRILAFFNQQGISRELLFYLFTEELAETRGGHSQIIKNDPLNPAFPAFQRSILLAMDYGLSSEPLAGKQDAAQKGAADDKAKETSAHWHLCFDKTHASATVLSRDRYLKFLSPVCGSGQTLPDPDTVTFRAMTGETVLLSIRPRSAFAIFRFLGRIIAAGDQGRIRLASAEAIDSAPFHDEYLFRVETGAAGPCFLSVDYEGEHYCVPLQGAANTKRVIAILTQLIALNTTVDEVPVTPTFRAIQ